MATLNEAQINEIVNSTKESGELVSKLTEEPYLKAGQEIFVKASMGQTNVMGKFVEENNGWAKIKRTDGTEFWVLYHQVYPKDSGLNSK